MKRILKFSWLVMLGCTCAFGNQLTEEQKIQQLLDYVRRSDVVFIRNNSEHTPKEAADHLEYKYKRATSSFFFFKSDKEVTARKFVDEIASQSSSSGRPYQVRLKDGEIKTTQSWLSDKLKELEKDRS